MRKLSADQTRGRFEDVEAASKPLWREGGADRDRERESSGGEEKRLSCPSALRTCYPSSDSGLPPSRRVDESRHLREEGERG